MPGDPSAEFQKHRGKSARSPQSIDVFDLKIPEGDFIPGRDKERFDGFWKDKCSDKTRPCVSASGVILKKWADPVLVGPITEALNRLPFELGTKAKDALDEYRDPGDRSADGASATRPARPEGVEFFIKVEADWLGGMSEAANKGRIKMILDGAGFKTGIRFGPKPRKDAQEKEDGQNP